MSLEVDMSKALHDLAGLKDSEVGDMREIVFGEGGRTITAIVKRTPPLGVGGKNAGAKQAGEAAIQKELGSLFSGAEPKLIREVSAKHGWQDIDGYIELENKTPLQVIWDHLSVDGSDMEALHKQYRNNRGKVRVTKSGRGRWRARVVVPTARKNEYIRRVQKRVGRWRASLAKGLPALGKSVPSWISRHFASVQGIAILDTSRLNSPLFPSIVFGSRAPGCGDPGFRQRCHGVIVDRIKAVRRRIKLVQSGYSKDVAQNMRPRKHAKETDTEPQEVLD